MMTIADFLAHAANLAFLLLIFIAGINILIKNKIVQLVLAAVFAVSVILFGNYHGINIVHLIHGVAGDLSISGLLFLILWAITHFTGLPVDLFDRAFCLIVAFIGLVLYLSVLDIIPVDVYQLGYLPNTILVIIFLLCMVFTLVNSLFALIWLIALVAFIAKIEHSVNLWDYLIDPALWLVCIYKLIFDKKTSTYKVEVI